MAVHVNRPVSPSTRVMSRISATTGSGRLLVAPTWDIDGLHGFAAAPPRRRAAGRRRRPGRSVEPWRTVERSGIDATGAGRSRRARVPIFMVERGYPEELEAG